MRAEEEALPAADGREGETITKKRALGSSLPRGLGHSSRTPGGLIIPIPQTRAGPAYP